VWWSKIFPISLYIEYYNYLIITVINESLIAVYAQQVKPWISGPSFVILTAKLDCGTFGT